MLIKKVKLCNKDATAYASDDSPSLTLLCGWCYMFLTNTTDKLQCKSEITWKPQDLPLSRAWWWCHFYKAEHVKIKSRGQGEEMGEERRDGLLCPIKQPSLFFWPLAVHYSQLLGWMHFFFPIQNNSQISYQKNPHQTGVCLFSFPLEKFQSN